MKPESLLVGKMMAFLNSIPGCNAEKRHGTHYGQAGQPDISGCYKGRRFEIEVKVPKASADSAMILAPVGVKAVRAMLDKRAPALGNVPTELQYEQLKKWQAAGALVCVAYSMEAVRRVVGELMLQDEAAEKAAARSPGP